MNNESTNKKANFWKTLGPGILFASTCIGASHLVQSTKAGALFGYSLLWAVVLANILKYPFFEFGSRYANATGKSLIDGYKKIGNWALYLYFAITLATMFLVTAAVGKVTAGFFQNLFGFTSSLYTTIGLFIICGVILLVGQFKVLDKLIKVIGITLLISTLGAFLATIINGPQGSLGMFEASAFPDAVFVIALMGWMPTAVDLSAWNSLWTVERIKETGYHPTLKETLFDFNFGYIISAVLAIFFLTMGAFLMYGTGYHPPKSSVAFSNDVVNLYTQSIGDWSYMIIASASFSIMFGTAIAVIDGYGRAVTRVVRLIFNQLKWSDEKLYRITAVFTIIGSLIVILSFEKEGFGALVNFAMAASFIVAPFIAVMNTKLVSVDSIGDKAAPRWLRILAYLGIVYLAAFSLYFLYVILF
jgi:Mn2+/Fe2+ NRAMP family transporter